MRWLWGIWRRFRKSVLWETATDITDVLAVIGAGLVAVGVLALIVSRLVDVDRGWYVLAPGVAMCAASYSLQRHHEKREDAAIADSAAEVATMQQQMADLAAEVAQMRTAPTVPVRLPPQRAVVEAPSAPGVMPPASPSTATLVEDLRRLLADGLALYNAIPEKDPDGLAAARAIAANRQPPPTGGQIGRWKEAVLASLSGVDQEKRRNAFLSAKPTGNAAAIASLAAISSGDGSPQRRLELSAKLRVLSQIVHGMPT